jgi:hypothetical protein
MYTNKGGGLLATGTNKRKFVSVLTILAMLLGTLISYGWTAPSAHAAEPVAVGGGLYLSAIDGSYLSAYDYELSGDTLTIKGNGLPKMLSGTSDTVRVVINYGDSVALTISGLDITASTYSPMSVSNQATLNLTVEGTNKLASTNAAALELLGESALTITEASTGRLIANGGPYSAGIGSSSYNSTNASITIGGGVIEANGGIESAGVGGASNANFGDITITGGKVTATGGSVGIGSGDGQVVMGEGYHAGTITISGGLVDASGIGTNLGDNRVDKISITGGTVLARGSSIRANGGWNNIVIDGGSVYSETGTTSPEPKNSKGDSVYQNTLRFKPSIADGVAITSGTVDGVAMDETPDASADVYGVKDIQAANGGNVYLWLPANAEGKIELATADSNYAAEYARQWGAAMSETVLKVGASATAAITKILKTPVGTATPAHTYTFTFTDGERAGGGADAPAIGNATVTFTAGDNGSEAGDVKTVTKQTEDILADVEWEDTGVYTYTVTETASGNTLSDGTASPYMAEHLTYSQAEYTLKVYVYDDGEGNLYAKYVEAYDVKDDAGEDGENEKIDPVPGDGEETFSDMSFTNEYYKTNSAPATSMSDSGALYVDEAVSGNMGNTSQPFTVSVKVAKPSLVGSAGPYKAYLFDADGVVDEPLTEYTDAEDKYYSFTDNSAKDVTLKHGQRLVFVDVPVGSTYTAAQSATANYVANVAVRYNGGTAATTENLTANNAVAAADVTTVLKMVGQDGANGAAFDNKYEIEPPTGIVIHNLPFAMLILLAGAALLLAARRTRRRDYEAL